MVFFDILINKKKGNDEYYLNEFEEELEIQLNTNFEMKDLNQFKNLEEKKSIFSEKLIYDHKSEDLLKLENTITFSDFSFSIDNFREISGNSYSKIS